MHCVNLGHMPEPLKGHTATAIGSKVFVMGGIGLETDRIVSTMFVYDFVTSSWTIPVTHGDLPPGRMGHACGAIGRQLFLFGGRDVDVLYNDFYVFNIDSNKWTRKELGAPAVDPRFGHSCTVVDDQYLYFIGGMGHGSVVLSDIWLVDTRDFSWTLCLPGGDALGPIFNHISASVGQKIFVFGGCRGSDLECNDLHVLELGTMTLTKQLISTNFPSPRACQVCVEDGDKLVFLGGVEEDPYNELYAFRTNTGSWDRVVVMGDLDFTRIFAASDGFGCVCGGSLSHSSRPAAIFCHLFSDLDYLLEGIAVNRRINQARAMGDFSKLCELFSIAGAGGELWKKIPGRIRPAYKQDLIELGEVIDNINALRVDEDVQQGPEDDLEEFEAIATALIQSLENDLMVFKDLKKKAFSSACGCRRRLKEVETCFDI